MIMGELRSTPNFSKMRTIFFILALCSGMASLFPEIALLPIQDAVWNMRAPEMALPIARSLFGVGAIDIRTLEVMRGQLPRRALALVLEWAQEHRAELMEDWELCSQRQIPKKIPPLR